MPKIDRLTALTSTLESFIPDWTQIGMHTRIIELVNNFNNRYGTDLGVTNKMRWKPGIYDKIQRAAIDVMFEKFKRKPANAYKWTEYSSWRMDRFRDDVHNIEKELFQCRQRGETLCTHIDIAKERYFQWIERIAESNENIFDSMDVGHQMEGIHYRRGRYGNYSSITRILQHPDTGLHYDDMPRVRFSVDLMNIIIHYNKKMDAGDIIEFARIPFGNMTINFELSLILWIG